MAASTSGLGWQAAFLEGTADFLVDRAQAELAASFVVRVGKDLCGTGSPADQAPKTRAMFPETCRMLDDYRSNPTLIFGQLFASTVRADLETVPVRMLPAEQAPVVDLLWHVARESRKGRSPLQLLAGLSVLASLQEVCKQPDPANRQAVVRLECGLGLLGALVQQLGVVSNERAFQELIQGETRRKELLAALAKLVRERIVPQLKADLTDEEWSHLQVQLEPKLWSLVSNLRIVHERVSAVERQEAYQVAGTAFSYRIASYSGASAPDLLQRARLTLLGTIDVLRDGLDIYKTVTGFQLTNAEQAFTMAEAISDAMVGSYGEGLRKALNVCTKVSCEIPPALTKHLPFIVNLSESKSSADIKAALESAAAPLGSWVIKRQRTSFTITGLVGAQGALEFSRSVPFGMGMGPMGLLGLELTTDVGKGWDVGAMASVLDLGLLVYPRVYTNKKSDESGVRENPNPELVQVLSPGLYFRAGVPNAPITLGVGGSLAPRLRCSLTPQGECDPAAGASSVFRLGLFAAVDVTVLNLLD